MSADDIADGWTQPTYTFEKSAELHLKIQTIEGVDPLDAQFGIDTPKTVPDALDLLPLESADISSPCSGFGPLLTVGDTPAG